MALLESSSLTDALSDALRKQIISGALAPGRRLTEIWVANTFEVARPTAKAGLDRLTSEGMLRRGPRRSAIVPRLSADDVNDIYFSREPVESRAIVRLAERSEVPPGAAYALTLMSVAAQQGLHTEHTAADVSFHRSLVNASSSPRLRRMHETVMGEAQLCIAQVRAHADVDLVALTEDHAAILEAIRRGEPEAAVAALKNDLYSCRDKLLADIERDAAALTT